MNIFNQDLIQINKFRALGRLQDITIKVNQQMQNQNSKYPNQEIHVKPARQRGTLKCQKNQPKPSLLEQFKLRTKQVLVDDIKMHKKAEFVRLKQKQEIVRFLKDFRNPKKQQLSQLIYYLLQKYIGYVNYKICFQYFLNGVKIKNFEQLFPLYGILDRQTALILTNTTTNIFFNQVLLNKTQDLQNLQKKTSLDKYNQRDLSQPNTSYKKNTNLMRKSGSFRQSDSSKTSNNTKSKQMMSPLQTYFQMISTGNLQSANRQKFPDDFSKKFKAQIDMFSQICQIIIKIIQYFNSTVLKDDPIEPEMNLNVLNDCLLRVLQKKQQHQKKQFLNKAKIQRQSQELKEYNKRNNIFLCSNTVAQTSFPFRLQQQGPSAKQLGELEQTRMLLNQKIIQHTAGKVRYSQLQTCMRNVERQNAELNDKFSELSVYNRQLQSLRQKQRQEKQSKFECQNCLLISSQSQKLKEELNKFQFESQKLILENKNIESKFKSQIQRILHYTKINLHLQSSCILEPVTLHIFQKIVVGSSALMPGGERKQLFSQVNKQLDRKEYLINQIESYASRMDHSSARIRAFKLVYKFNDQVRSDFHLYVDGVPKFLVLIQLQNGSILGGYSHQPLREGCNTKLGFIFSLYLMETFYLKEGHCLVYDQYYLIFGNSEIRVRVGQKKLYSNFGISNAYFQSKSLKFGQFLNSERLRQLSFKHLQVFQVIFQGA